MSAADLLSRLKQVRPNGKDKWVARCPAHADKSPSLAVAEADGKTLIHCFAGCGVDDILAAVGLEMDALFPPRESTGKPQRWSAHLALQALRDEITTAVVCGRGLQAPDLSDADRAFLTTRLSACMGRIEAACKLTGIR